MSHKVPVHSGICAKKRGRPRSRRMIEIFCIQTFPQLVELATIAQAILALAFLLCPREVLVTIPALAPIARAENHPAEFPTIPPNGLPSVNLGQWEGYRLLQGIASCESWGDPTGAVSS